MDFTCFYMRGGLTGFETRVAVLIPKNSTNYPLWKVVRQSR